VILTAGQRLSHKAHVPLALLWGWWRHSDHWQTTCSGQPFRGTSKAAWIFIRYHLLLGFTPASRDPGSLPA